MNRRIGLAALLGFVVSLLIHVASVSGTDVSSRYPYIWLLHVGMFAVFLPFVLAIRADSGPQPSLAAIVSRFSPGAVVLAIAAGAYSFVNTALFAALYEGNADIVNGEYVLSSHGHVLAHVTESQYHLHKAAEIRGFSGIWLFFYLIPCLYFGFRREPPNGQQTCQR